MTPREIRATIPLEPVPQHRPRAFGRCPRDPRACATGKCRPIVAVHPHDDDVAYRENAVAYLRQATPARKLEGPVLLSVLLLLPATKADARRAARRWHWKRPDVDNFVKAVSDAIGEAGWWTDDGQVSRLVVEKLVCGPCEEPAVLVLARELEPYGG